MQNIKPFIQLFSPDITPFRSAPRRCRALIDEISEYRRQKFQMTARRGTYLDMERFEMELDRCTSPIPFLHFGYESEMCSASPRITVLYAECMNSCLRFSGLS